MENPQRNRNRIVKLVFAFCVVVFLSHLMSNAVILATTIGVRTVGMILAWMFVFRYARVKNWNKSPEGRHLMSFAFVVGAFFTYATANNIAAWLDPRTAQDFVDGDYPGRLSIGLALYAWVAYEMHRSNTLLTDALEEK